MANCSTCKHNSYIDIKDCGWFLCSHPVIISKTPKAEASDPKFVGLMTTDFPISWLHNCDDCPTWESVSHD